MGLNGEFALCFPDTLGRCAENQNGNLRWHLPLRVGAGRDPSRVPHTYFEKLFF